MTSACGKYTHGDLLNRAMDICRDKYGACVWPKVPEDCFAKAFVELFPSYTEMAFERAKQVGL